MSGVQQNQGDGNQVYNPLRSENEDRSTQGSPQPSMFDAATSALNSGTAAIGSAASNVATSASNVATNASNNQSKSSIFSFFTSKVVPPTAEEIEALKAAYAKINLQDGAQVKRVTKGIISALTPGWLYGGRSRKSRIRKRRKTKLNVTKRSHRVLHHKR
jgi:hypothetical protein